MESTIRFKFDRNNPGLTWEEYEAIEMAQDGELKMRQMRPLVARFMVDDKGQPIAHKQAMATLGKLPMEEVRDVFTKFADALKDAAVPNGSGSSSLPPSEASTPASPSQDG